MTQVPDIGQLASDLKTAIHAWAHINIPIQSRFEQDGNWHFLDENQSWGFAAGGACAVMATMFRYDNTLTQWRDKCIESVEAALKWNMKPPTVPTAPVYSYPLTPSYPGTVYLGIPASGPRLMTPFDGGPWGNPDPIGSDENTTFEAIAWIVWVCDELYNSGGIDAARAGRWMKNLSYAADWLIYVNGNPVWYTNGNFVSHQALCYAQMAKLYRQLGDETNWFLYQQAYELTMQTLIYPLGNGYTFPPVNSSTWEGYGYRVTVQGTESTPTVPALRNPAGCATDGNTETGHLTETPGYQGINPAANEDYYYESVTLGILATIYVVNRDWRVNYLMNAMHNTIDSRISWGTTWNLDATSGSRKSFIANAELNYLAVMALIGRRQGNRSRLTSANVLGMFNTSSTGSLINFTANQVNQLPSAAARNWRTGIATALKACHLAETKIS